MVAINTHGRNSKGGGTPQHGARGNKMARPAVIPLAQTLPSVAPQPRFAPPPITQPRPGDGPNQSPTWRGGNAFDQLITRDREVQFSRGTEVAGRISSQIDPPMSGPIRPDLRAINRTVNWQVGTGAAYADDLSRDYTWLGEQGSGWTTVYGGAPGFYRQGPGGIPVGDPSQGPARVWGGVPHGYHTFYPPENAQTQSRQRATPQMRPARVDRLSNSRIAGQNYSQWTKHQGAS